MAAKEPNDTTNFNTDFDYEAVILNNVKSSDLQDIGTITLILEDILCIKDKDNQHFGLSKDDISFIQSNKELVLRDFSDLG